MSTIILGIESSCDDTSAAVIRDEVMLSNVMSSQDVHEKLMVLYSKGLIQQIRRKNRLYYAYNPETHTDFKFELLIFKHADLSFLI